MKTFFYKFWYVSNLLQEMELASQTGDNAIVFQGLTGEGPARLAMIMAYIALSINVKSESNAKR